MKRTPRRLIGMFITVAALAAVIPASAQALSLGGLAAAPVDAQAGAHSDFHIHMDFGGGQVKNLTIGLPPGMIGNPNATDKCTVAELNGDNCPDSTIVGSVTANASVSIITLPLLPPIDVNGDLYNLEPQPGEPARFGIVLRPLNLGGALPSLLPPIILQSAVQLRSDFGLNTVIKNIPKTTLSDGDTTINSQDITLFGSRPWMKAPFTRNPTSCGSHTTNFSAAPYSGASDTGQATFSTTGCGNEDFSPSFTASVGGPGQTSVGSLTTATTSINQDVDEAGLIKATVLVPGDLAPNVNLLGFRCPQANFKAGTCPATSLMGTAIAASPLLSQPLIGNVELVDSGGLLPNIGLDLQGQLHLLLQGALNADKSVVFDGLPDIPIARFQLAFSNPPGLLMANRDLCTPPPPLFHADFVGYNGATASVDAPAVVNGCGTANTGKCKKHKAKKKKHKHRAAESKKKHKKKRSCKKKHKNHKKHRK